MKKLTLIVPCFNEQEALPFFYKEAISVLKNLNYEYELLFINDGSKDNTLNILKDFADRDACVKYISFSRNFGKEAAMYAGFCNATGDFVMPPGIMLQSWMQICRIRQICCPRC